MNKQPDEEEVLRLLKEQPTLGIRKLTEQYGGLVYHITWRRLHGRLPKEDIEECVSDIFFECYQCVDKVDETKGNLKSLLLTIAKRRAIKYYERKQSPLEQVSIEELEESAVSEGSGKFNPSAASVKGQ